MLGLLTLVLSLSAADALRIQAKKKTTAVNQSAVPHNGATGSVTFAKQPVPIYDMSDEPYESVDFAGRYHGAKTQTKSEDEGTDPVTSRQQIIKHGKDSAHKSKGIAEAAKLCTLEASNNISSQNPLRHTPRGFPERSALPKGSFYGKVAAQHTDAMLGCAGDKCQIPTYLPPREEALEQQIIPRIIWMTMSDKLLAGELGPFHYNLISAHFKENPEYEMVISGDKMSDAFMQSDEIKKEWQEAYTKARNGAEKADIWRYAVMWKYGGVYMDSDMSLTTPYKTFLNSSSHVVQQLTRKGDLKSKESLKKYEVSQFALMYAPGNKLMESLLDDIAAQFQAGGALPLTIHLTGPGAMTHTYTKYNVCDIKNCGSAHPNKVCTKDEPAEECDNEVAGHVTYLHKGRDFNTGIVWHKADICAIAETRAKVAHWGSTGANSGGHGDKKKHQG